VQGWHPSKPIHTIWVNGRVRVWVRVRVGSCVRVKVRVTVIRL